VGVHILAYEDRDGVVHVVDADSEDELWRSDPSGGEIEVLAWSRDGERLIVLTGRRLVVLGADGHLILRTPSAGATTGAVSPDGETIAIVRRESNRSQLFDLPTGLRKRTRDGGLPFAGPGRFGEVTWSPDGTRLLLAWRDADQWLFIDPERARRIVAFGAITRQFDPGDADGGEFPRVAGWVLPER
jgi:WD40 repeat protein